MVVSVQFNPLKEHKTRVSPICVGAVLDKSHILTAAHCVGPYNPNELEVYMRGSIHSLMRNYAKLLRLISCRSLLGRTT